ncbi:MAG: extracellular solute-binding protein [Candidatus Methylomirabilota bacterium]
MTRFVLMLLALLLAVPGAFAQEPDPALVAKAKTEGKVSFYANITAVEPIMNAFTKKYGVKAEYTRISSPKFVATAVTEHGAGKLMADVLQSPIPILDMLKEKGILASYRSPMAANYPEWARKDDKITIFGIEYVGVIYNREAIKLADAPKSYEDLADPKWRGKIVMANPTNHPTTIAWLVGLREHVLKSDEAWMKFLRGLAANKPMFVASFGPTPAPIESGEKPIGISMPKYIVTKAPAPLDWARLSQPLMGTPRGIGLASSAPHPHAARLFLDYWLSREAQQILAKDVGEYVLYAGVFPPIPDIAKATVLPIRELSDDETKKWAAEFKKIFEAK